MMDRICQVIGDCVPGAQFEPVINIEHNYAAWENHFDKNVIAPFCTKVVNPNSIR